MICVSVANISFIDLMSQISDFDMLELRLDLLDYSDSQYQEIFKIGKPIIATYRYGEVNDEIRITELKKAILLGANYVDIEMDAKENFVSEMMIFAKQYNCDTILSFHDFYKTPTKESLNKIIEDAKNRKSDYIKIAVMANKQNDVEKVLSLYENNNNLLAFNMGEIGKTSRLSSLLLGAKFTYAALSDKNTTAEGQYTYRELKELQEKDIEQ